MSRQYATVKKSNYALTRCDGTIAYQGMAESKEDLIKNFFNIQRRKAITNGSSAHDTRDLDLSGLSTTVLNCSGFDLTGSSFDNSRIKVLEADDAILDKCSFANASIRLSGSNTKLRGIKKFHRSDISASELTRPDFSDTHIDLTNMENIKLYRPIMRNMTIEDSDISRSYIEDVDFFGATVEGCDLKGTEIVHKELSSLTQGIYDNVVNELPCMGKNMSVNGCRYDSDSYFSELYKPFKTDRFCKKIANISLTCLAAVAVGTLVEKGFGHAEPLIEHTKDSIAEFFSAHNAVSDIASHIKGDGCDVVPNAIKSHVSIYGCAALAITGGSVTLGRELLTDKLKENVKDALGSLFKKAGTLVRRAVRAGSDIKDLMCLFGPKDSMKHLKMALASCDGKKSKTQVFTDIISGVAHGNSIQIITCDKKHAALALEMLTRYYHRIQDRKEDISIVLGVDQNGEPECPSVVTLKRDGDMIASWFRLNERGDLVRDASIQYSKDNTIIGTVGRDGHSMDSHDVTDFKAADSNVVLKRFIRNVMGSPDMNHDIAFDLDKSYLDSKPGGGFVIRSIETNLLDNDYGPAVVSSSDHGYFFKDGNIQTFKNGNIITDGNIENLPKTVDKTSIMKSSSSGPTI